MEKKLLKEKAAREEALRLLENEINLVTSDISKTTDTLTSFQQYKQFMM